MHPVTAAPSANPTAAGGAHALPGLPLVGSEPRPHRSLFTYYTLSSLVLGPFFWILLIPLYFRYHTMRYRFDEEGVSMRWGILFRREISLTYARIQDIHLSSNFVERWLGLARIQIQTASGNAGAEMTIEGLREFEQIRDFLYARMRGTHTHEPARAVVAAATPSTGAAALGAAETAELASTLSAVAAELRALRAEMEARDAMRGEGTPHG